MTEETNNKDSFIKNLVINLLYMLLFLFLFMWIYPAPKVDLSKIKVDLDTTAIKPLLNGIYNDNIEAMRTSARNYYTIERLPKNVGDKSSMTLNNMLSRKLLVPFVDEEGNYCDANNSYVEVIKNDIDYSLKVYLSCNNKKDYIIDTIGCNSNCNNTSTNANNVIATNTKTNNVVSAKNLGTNTGSNTVTRYVEYVNVVNDTTSDNDNTNTNNTQTYDYSKKPVWSNNSDHSCNVGDSSCNKVPNATDPYSGNALSVRLISSNININSVGTYTVTYEAYTEHNVYGTTTFTIKVIKNNTMASRKYITNYTKSYYNDGYYKGYLELDYNTGTNSKYITNYAWTNRVSYTYKCVNNGEIGTDGWVHISTNTSDNHPTVYYSYNNYAGTLYKQSFYCKEGCSNKLASELGTCYNVGQTKTIYRTWVGIYAGYVYSTRPNTYSGYVYLIS